MAFPIIAAMGAVFEFLGGLGKAWMEKKKIEAQGKIAIAQAKVDGEVKRVLTITEGDVNYDLIAAQEMETSWKDEWFVILLSIPAVLCFVPGMAKYVQDGFTALQGTPQWYQWAFLGAIVASFGLKSLVRPFLAKWFGTRDTSLPVEVKDKEDGK